MKAIFLLSILILMFNLVTIDLHAQEFIVNGAITEKGTTIRIALAIITNKRTGQSVGSNDMGLFQIKSIIGDTLIFEKRNFTSRFNRVMNNGDISVLLQRESLALDEVTIKGQTKKEDLEEIRNEFIHKGSFYLGKPPLMLLNPFGGSPLTFLYELLGKTPAKARRFNRYYKSELRQMEVDQFFNQKIITKNTTLKGKDLNKFMLDYSPKNDLVKNWTNYDAVKYIKESAKKFTDTLKNPN